MSLFFFFSSRRRHTRFDCDWSSDVCSSDLMDTARFVDGRKKFQERLSTALEVGDSKVDRKSTRLNSSHSQISYAVFCLKKKKTPTPASRHSIVYVYRTPAFYSSPAFPPQAF